MRASFFDYDPSISGYRYIVLTEEDPTLDTHTGGATDEGYIHTYTRWALEGETVTCETTTDGRDCDGHCSHSSVYACDVVDLATITPSRTQEDEENGTPPLPFKVPAWESRSRSQRDYTAEAAGY